MWLRDDVAEELLARIEESDKAISGAAARDKIMWSQTGIFMDMGMANKKVMQQGLALYQQTMSNMRVDVMNLVTRFQGGTMDMGEAISAFKNISGRHYQTLFKAGAMAMGNPYYADPAIGLTKKDLAFISSARRFEGKFFKKFLLDMSNPNFRPVHSFAQRAGYYADSGKAQFYNGMVNGAGENVVIHWVLGTVEEHCGDCPVLATKTYTWQTLPTTPGAGDTECLFNCACHLEIEKRESGKGMQGGGGGAPKAPGSSSPAATEAPGRWSKVTVGGVDMEGMLAMEFDDMFAQMNKARQMVHLTTGQERKGWIQARRGINDAIIQRAKSGGYRVTPTASVIDLLAVVDKVTQWGMTRLLTIDTAVFNQEVALIRGDVLVLGKVRFNSSGLFIETAKGQYYKYSVKSDLLLAEPTKGTWVQTTGEPATLPQKPAAGMTIKQYKELPQTDSQNRGDWMVAVEQTKAAVAVKNPAGAKLYTASEEDALNDYLEHTYSKLNRHLRTGSQGDSTFPMKPAEIKSHIAQLDKAMKRGALQEDMVLHRVSQVSGFGELKVGTVFVDKGYLSCSTQINGAENLKRADKWRIKVLVPEGTPAVSMLKAFPDHSIARFECEILLARGCTFKVLDVSQNTRSITIELIKSP